MPDYSTVNLYDLWRRPPQEHRYWLRPLIPKDTITIFSAPTGLGKSLVALELCECLTTGSPFLNYKVDELGSILLLDQELGEPVYEERTKIRWPKEAPTKIKRISLVSKNFRLKIDTFNGAHLLHKIVSDIKPEILILDPISLLMDGNESDGETIGHFYIHLRETMKYIPGMSVVLFHHVGKPNVDKDPLDLYAARGHSRIVDFADQVITATIRKYDYEKRISHQTWRLNKLRHSEEQRDLLVKRDAQLRYSTDSAVPISSAYKTTGMLRRHA